MKMKHTTLCLVIFLMWSMSPVDTRCILYNKYMDCYQDETNVIPRFSQYKGTLNLIRFRGNWVMRKLDENLLTDMPLTNQLQIQNIGLQHLSCDVFTNLRQELTVLNLDDNMLTHFPACSVNNLFRLKELSLSKNFISCIPEHSIPSSLTIFDVSYNQIYTLNSDMSTDVYNRNTLKKFIIRGNKLKWIRDNELEQFYNLDFLDMSENRLEYIHPKSFTLSGGHLVVIDLSQNQLTSDVWLALEHLPQVQNLNLSHNQIDHVTNNVLSSKQRLQNFDISYNMVTEVGAAFDHHHTVQGLFFHHNQITKVSADMIGTKTKFMHLFELDLSFNRLSSADLTINDCLNCTFSIHHNKLNSMLLSSNQNSTFRLIDVSFNMLEEIPPNLPLWTNFNGSHNSFSTVSVMAFLTRLPNQNVHDVILRNTTFMCKQASIDIPAIVIPSTSENTLNLADNCVPPEFWCFLKYNMTSPSKVNTSIYLDRNGLQTLNECHLSINMLLLSLKGNHLRFLNESFVLKEMPDLEYLDLAENDIHSFPVLKLPNLNVTLNNLQELPAIEMSNLIGIPQYNINYNKTVCDVNHRPETRGI